MDPSLPPPASSHSTQLAENEPGSEISGVSSVQARQYSQWFFILPNTPPSQIQSLVPHVLILYSDHRQALLIYCSHFCSCSFCFLLPVDQREIRYLTRLVHDLTTMPWNSFRCKINSSGCFQWDFLCFVFVLLVLKNPRKIQMIGLGSVASVYGGGENAGWGSVLSGLLRGSVSGFMYLITLSFS